MKDMVSVGVMDLFVAEAFASVHIFAFFGIDASVRRLSGQASSTGLLGSTMLTRSTVDSTPAKMKLTACHRNGTARQCFKNTNKVRRNVAKVFIHWQKK